MHSLTYLPSVSSTNDYILQLADEKAESIVGVYTFSQTKGRGQYGNLWHTEPAKNIAYSFILPADVVTLSESMFNFYTALLLSEFLAKITDMKVEVKWPNDIIIKQKKIVGILLEKKKLKHIPYYIVGCGINVLQEDFAHFPKGSSLKLLTGKTFDLHELTRLMHQYFCRHLLESISDAEVLKRYNQQLFRKDKISVFEMKGKRRNGIIRHVDEAGYLWVELDGESELQKFFYKEITLLY